MSTRHIPYPADFTIGHAAVHQINPHVACAGEVAQAF
jgi:hypothetical protein